MNESPRVGVRRIATAVVDVTAAADDMATAERRLADTPGVDHAYLNTANRLAYVIYDPARCDLGTLTDALVQADSGAPLPAVERTSAMHR